MNHYPSYIYEFDIIFEPKDHTYRLSVKGGFEQIWVIKLVTGLVENNQALKVFHSKQELYGV
jgi:hypothetical protein